MAGPGRAGPHRLAGSISFRPLRVGQDLMCGAGPGERGEGAGLGVNVVWGVMIWVAGSAGSWQGESAGCEMRGHKQPSRAVFMSSETSQTRSRCAESYGVVFRPVSIVDPLPRQS